MYNNFFNLYHIKIDLSFQIYIFVKFDHIKIDLYFKTYLFVKFEIS